MPYRHIQAPTSFCTICSTNTARSCRNCQAPHCEEHLIGASCAGCTGALWQMERQRVSGVLGVYGAGAVLASFGLAILGLAVAVLPLAMGAMVVHRVAAVVVRHRLADRRLAPSSRALPPAEIVRTQPGMERSERPRPRHGLSPYRSRAPRAVFMTRGGYFYQ